MLINDSGIGSDHLISMVGTWQPAFGETSMMLGSEVLEKLIDVLLVLRDSCKTIFNLTPPTSRKILTSIFRYTEWRIERLRLLIKDDASAFELTSWVD